ncbi:MAG: tetratricopeptide (TPR) repeat protein [Limisphaerales bacterium]|jgi:tetratricopeptide (TPR) repeat protein
MGAIINFKPKSNANFDFKRARRKRKGAKLEERGPLKLFNPNRTKVKRLSLGFGPFEEALLLDDRGDPSAADRYKKAVAENDYPADALCNLGIIESSNGNRTNAFDCFTRSLRLDPKHFESHYNLGNLYFDISDYTLAKTHYEFAMAIDDSYSNLYYNLGLLLALEKQYKKAVSTLHQFASMANEEDALKAKTLANRIIASAAMDGT